MESAKALTHILFPVFIGLIVCGAASNNNDLFAWGIFLLILDIIIGICLQYLIDKESKSNNDDWSNLSFEEKRAVAHTIVEKAMQDMRDDGIDIDGEIERFCDEYNREHRLGKYSTEHYYYDEEQSAGDKLYNKFDAIYLSLEEKGGARLVDNIRKDEAGAFLLDVCEQMPHAPLPYTLSTLYAISIENLSGEAAIVYSFKYTPNSICQNVFIFLVHTKDDRIRLFAAETDYSAFVLCEYYEGRHLNYGRVELKNIPTRIKEILNS